MLIKRRSIARSASSLVLLSTLAGCRCRESAPAAPQTSEAKTLIELQRMEWRRVSGPLLKKSLHAKSTEIRARAMLVAGRLGRLSARPALILALDDPQAEVRVVAAFALQLLVLDRAPSLAKEVAAALSVRLSKERDPAVRWRLILGLGAVGDSSARPVLRALLSKPGIDAEAAAIAWGLLGQQKASQKKTLGAKGDSRALLPSLRHADLARRFSAAWAVARIGGTDDAEVIAALKAIAETPRREQLGSEARRWAIKALAARAAPLRVDWFAKRLGDFDPAVQSEAARALGRGGVRGAVKLAKILPKVWRGVASSHYRLTGARLHPVLVGLEALIPYARIATVKRFAADALEFSDAADSAVNYSPTEAHSVDLVHCALARLVDLGLGRPEHIAICGTARSKALSARRRRAAVAEVVGRLKRRPEWKITMLRRYLADPAPLVRLAAVSALGDVDDRLIELPLRARLADASPAVIGAVAEVIQKRSRFFLDDNQLALALAKRLSRMKLLVEPEAGCALIGALGALRYRKAETLLARARRSANWAVRNCALKASRQIFGGAVKSAERWPSSGVPDLRWAGDQPLPTRAVIVTKKGEIFLELLSQAAPATVASFARLATKRFFRGLPFHRVVPNFVVQGGDPTGTGWGGPGYTLPCELTPLPYLRGSVGMALAGRDTGGSQFFITTGRQPHLDGRYTLFAKVVRGMEVVDRLQVGDVIKDLYVLSESKRRDQASKEK